MSGPFRVERIEGCGQCGHGELFDVIGPDDVAHSTQYGDEEEARSICHAFDRAYELGRQAALLEAHPWTAFAADTLPPDGSILVWDAQFNNITSSYWISSINNLETAQKMHWSHWVVLERIVAPPPGASREPPPVVIPPAPPTLEPPLDQATEKAIEPAPDWTDDIPF